MNSNIHAFVEVGYWNEITREAKGKSTERLEREIELYEQIQQERKQMGVFSRLIDYLSRSVPLSHNEYKVSKRILGERTQPSPS